MKKTEVMPKVIIYQDMFEDLDKVLDVIKKSETDASSFVAPLSDNSIPTDDHGIDPVPYEYPHVIRQWVPWYEFGTRSSFTFTSGESQDKRYLDEEWAQKKLSDAIEIVLKDYSNEWSSKEWPEYAKGWFFNGSKGNTASKNEVIFGTLDILKHKYDVEQDFALPFHTDFHNHTSESPGFKPVVTVTVYLNDDYEGGEIQFVNQDLKEIITYKPKAGDITIFPSTKPYWHSALPVKLSNKYLLRSFILIEYDGSENWHKSVEQYGIEKWNEIEHERILKEIDDGRYGIHVTSDFNTKPEDIKEDIIFVKEENKKYVRGDSL